MALETVTKCQHCGEPLVVHVSRADKPSTCIKCAVEEAAKKEAESKTNDLAELLAAANDCIFDLEMFVKTHGPGPDNRLERLKRAIANMNSVAGKPVEYNYAEINFKRTVSIQGNLAELCNIIDFGVDLNESASKELILSLIDDSHSLIMSVMDYLKGLPTDSNGKMEACNALSYDRAIEIESSMTYLHDMVKDCDSNNHQWIKATLKESCETYYSLTGFIGHYLNS